LAADIIELVLVEMEDVMFIESVGIVLREVCLDRSGVVWCSRRLAVISSSLVRARRPVWLSTTVSFTASIMDEIMWLNSSYSGGR
jgi:hypothetical protein